MSDYDDYQEDELDRRVMANLFEAIVAAREGIPDAGGRALEAFLELFPSYGAGVATTALIVKSRAAKRSEAI
jgi:hypothetical protein